MAYMSHTGYLCVLPRIVRLVHLVGLQAIGAGGQVLLQHLVQILASMCSRSLARHPGLERLAGLKLYGFNGLYEPYRLFMCSSPHRTPGAPGRPAGDRRRWPGAAAPGADPGVDAGGERQMAPLTMGQIAYMACIGYLIRLSEPFFVAFAAL